MLILFVSSAKPGATPEALKATIRDELAMAWDLYKRDIQRQIFSRQDRLGAVAMLECESLAAAQRLMAELPLVQKDLIEYQLIPLAPFASLELLFAGRPPA